MLRQLVVGIVAGVAFLILDVVLNANPLARRLYASYQPIVKPSVNVVAASAIDVVYGVVLVLLFVMLRESLPGQGRLAKALSFGLIVWFLRVCMRVTGEWVITVLPAKAHAYTLIAGLIQILIVACIIAMLVSQTDGRGTT